MARHIAQARDGTVPKVGDMVAIGASRAIVLYVDDKVAVMRFTKDDSPTDQLCMVVHRETPDDPYWPDIPKEYAGLQHVSVKQDDESSGGTLAKTAIHFQYPSNWRAIIDAVNPDLSTNVDEIRLMIPK